jgi:hypothetical protein
MIAPRTLAMCLTQVQRDASLGFDLKLIDGEHINGTFVTFHLTISSHRQI